LAERGFTTVWTYIMGGLVNEMNKHVILVQELGTFFHMVLLKRQHWQDSAISWLLSIMK
jgi:hypothetical protein